MNNKPYQLYCCGSRGSRPVEGKRFNEFGGFTSCYVLKKDDYALIIDCGTGLYEANSIVLDCSVIDVVLTHMHYDHVLGMLDWTAIPTKPKLTFYSGFESWFGDKTFKEFFRKPFWPVQPNFTLKETPKGEPLKLNKDLSIDFYPAPHPDESQIMIIHMTEDKEQEHNIVVMFDSEDPSTVDRSLIQNCDYLLYDGMYTDDEYPKRKGFGHSTWQEGCRYAAKVNCKRLIVTHHDPNRTDEELRKFEQLARDIYPDTDFARSGQSWSFPIEEYKEMPKTAKIAKTRERLGSPVRIFTQSLDEVVLNKDRLSHFLTMGCYVIMGAVSLFMTLVNIFTGKKLLMASTLVFAILCAINIVLDLKIKNGKRIAYLAFQIQMIVLLTFFIVSGTPEGFSAIWALILPVGGMLVFGKKRTTILSSIMLGIMIFFFRTPIGRSMLHYRYTDSFMLRFPLAFIAFFILAFFLESVRESTFTALENLKDEQADIIADQTSELREQNFGMLRINSKLQLRNQLLTKALGQVIPEEEISDNDTSDERIRELLMKK